ncbi:hemagglutinin repeat-containing protein [Salmonella enterica]|nr:hypothetical protein [Salmonella enterica subsp. enterica serovar Reading]EHP0931379.1 hemagglutinin repeat-containing protein [Salmonella enterica]EHX6384959.1 hemagglutinin repeat-containing protein [Salmonella enterica subsp. enterica serovar Reading]
MSVLLSPLSLQAADIRRSGEDTFIIQQQRQEALEQQLTPSAPDVRLSAPGSFAHKINFPVETPCFQIKQTELKGADALPHWLPLQKIANGAVGHCLGAKGINLLMSTLQNRLVDHGYVTTRVLAPSQDLKSGILRLVIIPGVVRHVRLTPDSDDYIQLYSSFPAHEGSLLDLRDIEQGLENMQRLPGVQADMEIVPGEQPGESDILITRKQDKYWRLGFSLDDSGTRSTGRYLGGITFSLDNPFSLSDLLYVSATHNFPHYGGKGSKNYTAHYSVPFGYWQFSVTASDYDYHQTVAGAVEDYQYSGESQNLGMQLSRVLHRNGTQKTVLTYDVQARRSRNYINDTEIQVQRRQTAAWRLGLQHRHYISQATLDAGVSWQRGTRWFGAQPAPEEIFGEATALSKILQMNASFKLAGKQTVQLSAENIHNQAGTIQGANVSLTARTDINSTGGLLQATDSLLAMAGRDISLTTTTRTAQSDAGQNHFERTSIDSVAGVYVQNDQGRLVLQAGRDINLTAATVVNQGKDSLTQLSAGRDMTLSTVTTSAQDNIIWDKNNRLSQGVTQSTGSTLAGNGDVTLTAGRDMTSQAALLSAQKGLALMAGHDVTLTGAQNTRSLDEYHKVTGSSGMLSKTTTTTHDVTDRRTMTGSELNGDTVSIGAGHNLNVTGSSVAGDNRVSLAAGNNLNIGTLTESNRETHLKQEKKSGLMSSGGVGFSMGSQSLKVTDTATDTTQKGSTVGSVHGDVSLQAGNRLTVNSSDLIAGRDMALSGKEVSITAATDQHVQTHTVEQKTSGLTLALSGTAGSALNTTVEAVQAAKSAGNSRLEALQGVKAALSGAQAVQAGRLAEAQGNQKENNNTVGISLSYGSQSSKSEQQSEQTVAKGSTLTAGNNLSIQATGSGVKGVDGDLTIQGGQIKAGNNVLLQANRDVNLVSAENTSKLEGKNTSRGGSVGVGIGVGPGGPGFSLSASANQGKGSEKGNGTTHTETTVDAGNRLTIISGRDTTLTGAQAGGETVKVDAGRHLTLTSEQDSDRYDSKQQNASAGGSFTFGSMSGSASVSLSRDKMHSNYDSVQEQTGIFAGRGGFDVTTGQHTQLNGAVIASTATADKNRLDTGTLGFSDIDNWADFKTEHQSAGLSTGGSVAGNFLGNMANNLLVGANHEGHADSTTQSAVSAGNITIRDTQSQKQDVADLKRDAAHANQTLSPIFDREKEQQRLQQAQLIGEIGNQVADIARTEGQIAGEKAKRDPAALNQARAELEAAGKPFTEQDVAQRAYNNGMAASGFGTGGKYQQAIQAATAAVQGLAGGNLSAALAGGAAPYIAEIIKQTTPDGAGRVAAHAVVNAALAVAQGNNALAGAAGAATGEVVGMIATQMYGKPVSELSETEKQTVSTLATVAAGLAGGLVGDSGASAVAGVQSGKTTVENNALSKDKIFDINPMLKIGVEDVDGELLKGGGGIANGRPSHRQSEKDVGKDLGAGWREQVSYKDGKEVPYGTKGSTRPDWCNGNTCGIEVKNYNIATNINGLINNVSKQAIHRAENLPAGMQQRIIIDVRGQIVTPNQERTIIKGIVERSNGVIAPTSIRFKR